MTIQRNWQELIKPTKLDIVSGSDNARVASVVAEPLERGYGLTLGNALRRVLLSSLQGTAITAIQIDGILHEFSSLPGVREDITDLVLNVKEIALKMNSEGPKRLTLSKQGPGAVTAGDIRVTGIPIHPVFARPKSRAECLARHGLAGDRPVILQLAGGFGVGPVVKIARSLLSVERSVELVVVAGRNEKVRRQMGEVAAPARHRLQVLGFTDQIDELMTVADLVVSKPGGLTTSEALASGLAMVIVNPIPGQESRNSDYLLENGAAMKVNNLATLAYKVAGLFDPPDRLARLQENARRLGRPRAAYDVVDESLKLLTERG